MMNNSEKIKVAEDATNTDPTEKQKESGNYKKGKVTLEGLKITIENPVGSVRSGVDINGESWSNKMLYTYGYFNSTIGKDGDPIDVYLGRDIDEDFDVYIVDQVEESSRAFDEHKVMFGFKDKEDAKEAYLSCYSAGWEGFQNIISLSLSKFKEWLKNKDAIKYPASKLNMASKIDYKNAGRKNIGEKDDIATIRLFGEVLDDKTLNSLKAQLARFEDYQTIIVEIASPGGSVSEGLEIMVWLDQLMQDGIQVITVVVANAYSIASLIMLTADIKLISKHGKVMVHNPMVPELEYVNANDLEVYIKSLRELEALMYQLYKTFTGLEEEVIKSLMDNETYLLPQEAVDNGFADMVIDIKPKSYQMAINIKKKINMHKTLNILNRVIGKVNGANLINQLYYTNSGSEIKISQADPSTFKVGDKVSIEEGEVKLLDGSTLSIKGFKITDISKETEVDPAVAEFNEGPAPEKELAVEDPMKDPTVEAAEGDPVIEPTVDPATEPVKAAEGDPIVEPIVDPVMDPAVDPTEDPARVSPSKVIEKTKTIETTKETVNTTVTQVNEWESEVINDTFELETKVEYAPYEEGGESHSVGSGEWKLEDGRTVLTDAGGIIRWISEAPAPVAVEEDPIVAPEVDPMVKKDEDILAKIDALEARAKAAEEKVARFDAKFEESARFEALATEAINTITSSTVSNFKPDVKSVVTGKVGGSIFARMKIKAGIDS